jgi:hypothetical protein
MFGNKIQMTNEGPTYQNEKQCSLITSQMSVAKVMD